MTKRPYYLRDYDVVAPDELEISTNMSNEKAIARWWADVKLYVQAMEGLERAVLLIPDDASGCYRLSSHPFAVER